MPMPLVPSYNTKRIFGTWVRQGGTEMRPGTYKVTVPVRITNATDNVIIPQGEYAKGSLNLTPGVPSLDLQVPCTNDPDNSPSSGWQLLVEITFPDAPGERYVLDVPIDSGDINLRTVILVQTFPTPQPVLFRGVAGGVAALDADGDVVNADGEKVTAGAGGVSSWAEIETLPDKPDLVVATDARLTNTRTPTDGTVNAAKIATGFALLTTAERTQALAAQSASQVDTRADARISTWVGAAPGALDTLVEIASRLGADQTALDGLVTAVAGKATIGLAPPVIYATSATAFPVRSTWIAANCPGYTGPVVWNSALYLDHPGPTTSVDGDEFIDRITGA